MIKWLKSLFTPVAQYSPEEKKQLLQSARENGEKRRAGEKEKLKTAVEEVLAEKSAESKLTELEQSLAQKVTAVDVSHLSDDELEAFVEKLNSHSQRMEQLLEDSANKTDEENLADITAAAKELETLLGVKFESLEDFMANSGTSQVVPFTTIENFNDAAREMEHHTDMAEMRTDLDLVEELLNYHNKGYEMDGLVDIYKKLERKDDLTKLEQDQLKQWYVLVGMELVYNV